MDQVAETYVQLVLAVGQHDPNYVDAYYGPSQVKEEAERTKASLDEIQEMASTARANLGDAKPEEPEPLRHRFLAKQLEALLARVAYLRGDERSFDEESKALYDVVDQGRPDSYYAGILERLEPLLPGDGSLAERYDRLRSRFQIPKDRVDAVFRAAIDAARENTKRHIPLPEGEDFRLEYVSGEVWSAYNWYQGGAHSLIQVNADFAIPVDRALSLACHEGYPGHHVYNALLERYLAWGRGWAEFTVYPLYSPQSLIAEGTAEYGVELSFSPAERLAFEREVLLPLARLGDDGYEDYVNARSLIEGLGYASNDAARRYLDGEASHEETVDWLVRYSLSTPERAAQRIRFFEAHRSYVVTYNVGQDLVREYVESLASSVADRWMLFAELLSTPQTPSNLIRK